MTRIDEMDEFFNFEEATNTDLPTQSRQGIAIPFHTSSSSYNVDQILAPVGNNSYSRQSSHQFATRATSNGQYGSQYAVDVRMGEASDSTQGSRWTNGAKRPPKACINCQTHRFECLVTDENNTSQRGACTSCTALSQRCSFSFKLNVGLPDFAESVRTYEESFTNSVEYGASYEEDGYATRSATFDQSLLQESMIPRININQEASENSGKSAARFSRETVRILRDWLSVHNSHPYPTEQEKDDLTLRTGLTKIQVTNWLANARRRGQVRMPRTKSPSPYNVSDPVTIHKLSTQAPKTMSPMERWKSSPPEHDPASVTDIVKAVKTTPGILTDETTPDSYPHSEAGSVRSVTSSRNTSHSSHNSVSSAHSLHSRGSFNSFGQRGRRRRRPVSKAIHHNPTAVVPRQYQCTFCLETFKTKHDWQRHEKSLHLSLERWICAYNVGGVSGTARGCAFCGIKNADSAHYEKHNHMVCQERSLEERTFYRKDHLRQHLRLVHDCQFVASTMESWKIAAPKIRSRCGFCAATMNTWAARTDHLAEHFKSGKTMADWEGSWGFDPEVQKLVEDGMPPYLIHSKRMAVMSGEGLLPPLPVPVDFMTPYDQLKTTLVDFATRQTRLGRDVSDDELKNVAAQAHSEFRQKFDPTGSISSWFRDMIMCPDETLWLDRIRAKAKSEADGQNHAENPGNRVVNIDDKESVEKYCEFERQLTHFVNGQKGLGNFPSDKELRLAGCRIIFDYDKMHSKVPSATSAYWFCDQVMSSRTWVTRFRQRNGLPANTETQEESDVPGGTDSTVHSYHSLEAKLAEFVEDRVGLGMVPSDAELQQQARLIVFDTDDPFLQTAADDTIWLNHFKCMHGLITVDGPLYSMIQENPGDATLSNCTLFSTSTQKQSTGKLPVDPQNSKFVEEKYYQRIEGELSRFVFTSMTNVFRIPTDDDLRQRAKIIMYNDNSPWRLTVIDKPEWLLRFKRSIGLAPPADDNKVPSLLDSALMQFDTTQTNQALGLGNGFGMTPPQSLENASPIHQDSSSANWPMANMQTSSSRTTPSIDETTDSFPEPTINPDAGPWSLQSHLTDYISQSMNAGFLPSDEQLRIQARCITGTQVTPADNPILLQKFKAMCGIASEIHPSNFSIDSSINFNNLDHVSSSANTNVGASDAGRLTAHWKPTTSRSASNLYQTQGETAKRIRRSLSAGRRTSPESSTHHSSPAGNYTGRPDPQLWGSNPQKSGNSMFMIN